MTATTRHDRRQAELAQRRQSRRRSQQQSHGRSALLWMSLGAIVLGIVVIGAIALLRHDAPPAGEAVDGPIVRTNYSLADGMALGPASAPLTIEVWSDYQCPSCQRFVTTWENSIIDKYVATGQVRLVYRDFAFIGAESADAAVAARCAGNQGQYWPFHDYLFANQNGENRGWFSSGRLQSIAQSLGLDLDAFNGCRADPAIGQAVGAETMAGRAAGVAGTPTLALAGVLRPDITSWDAMVAAVDAALVNAAP
jgi:protein-disulfide isomerase